MRHFFCALCAVCTSISVASCARGLDDNASVPAREDAASYPVVRVPDSRTSFASDDADIRSLIGDAASDGCLASGNAPVARIALQASAACGSSLIVLDGSQSLPGSCNAPLVTFGWEVRDPNNVLIAQLVGAPDAPVSNPQVVSGTYRQLSVQLADTQLLDGQYAIRVTTKQGANNNQLYQESVPREAGNLLPDTNYQLAFTARSLTATSINVYLHKHRANYDNYGLDHQLTLTSQWQRFSVPFKTSGFSAPLDDARLRFFFGSQSNQFWFDNVVLSADGSMTNIIADPSFENFATQWKVYFENNDGSWLAQPIGDTIAGNYTVTLVVVDQQGVESSMATVAYPLISCN